MDSGVVLVLFGAGIGIAWWIRQARNAEPPPVNPELVCPHCNAKGQVRTYRANRKQGISGGKATAGVLTGTLSLWVTGLSRKQQVTHMVCGNCQTEWDVA